MYETVIDELYSDPAKLVIQGLHDRAYVYVDGNRQGILSRMGNINSMPMSRLSLGQKLQIIVENQGRICFGPHINELKGSKSKGSLTPKSKKPPGGEGGNEVYLGLPCGRQKLKCKGTIFYAQTIYVV